MLFVVRTCHGHYYTFMTDIVVMAGIPPSGGWSLAALLLLGTGVYEIIMERLPAGDTACLVRAVLHTTRA